MSIEMSVIKSYTIRIDADTRDALLTALNAWQGSVLPNVNAAVTAADNDDKAKTTVVDQYNRVRRFTENLTQVDEHGFIKSS
jgi:hypothetical protein